MVSSLVIASDLLQKLVPLLLAHFIAVPLKNAAFETLSYGQGFTLNIIDFRSTGMIPLTSDGVLMQVHVLARHDLKTNGLFPTGRGLICLVWLSRSCGCLFC